MKTTSLFLLVIGLVVGLGAGLLIGPNAEVDSENQPDEVPSNEKEGVQHRDDNGSNSQRDVIGDMPEEPDLDEPTLPAMSLSLEQALEEIELPELPSGDGIATVYFVDPDGNPVVGVELSLNQDIGNLFYRRPQREDFTTDQDYLLASIRWFYMREKCEQLTTQTKSSDKTGKIEFANLTDSRCRLQANFRQHLLDGRMSRFGTGIRAGQERTFTLVAAGRVSLNITGNAPDTDIRCSVSWSQGEYSGSTYVTRSSGTEVLVPLGDVTFSASKGSSKPNSPSVSVNVSSVVQTVELELKLTQTISGAVEFDGPTPLDWDWNLYMAKSVSGASDSEILRAGAQVRLSVDKQTRVFATTEEYEGEYVIGIVSRGDVLSSSRVILGQDTVELTLVVPDPGTRDALTLNIRRDLPASDQEEIIFQIVDPEDRQRRFRPDVWKVDGSKYLLRFREKGLEQLPRDAIIRVDSSILGVTEVDWRPGVEDTISVHFQAPCRLTVVLKDVPSGQFYMRIEMAKLTSSDDWESQHAHGRAEARNRIVNLGGVQPGGVVIRALGGRNSQGWRLAEVEVELKSGAQTVELEIPDLHSVRIDATAEPTVGRASLANLDTGEKGWVSFGQDHVAIVTDLPPGNYQLSYRRNDNTQLTTEFSVPQNNAVVLTGD